MVKAKKPETDIESGESGAAAAHQRGKSEKA
jgi:hypothetical protein